MKAIRFQYCYFFCFILILLSCSFHTRTQKIKKIEYYRIDNKVDHSKAGEIYKTKQGLNRIEEFDGMGNLIKESTFYKDTMLGTIIERKFDQHNNLIEQVIFSKNLNQTLTKTYLEKYLYSNNLLVEVLFYYGTFDSTGFWARRNITYNEKKQKIKETFVAYNEDAEKGTSIFTWKDAYNYIEDRIDRDGVLAERHFVKLNKQGKELEHKINYEVSSEDDFTYQVSTEKKFDQYGNELFSKWTSEVKPVEITTYQYLYDRENWKYRLQHSDGYYYTEFRKITYY